MNHKTFKHVLVIAVFASSWLNGLTTAEGCWFRRMFGGTTQTTYMLPVAAAPAPAAAYTTGYPPSWQTALYAPQTQYQTLWRPYPVTTYNPVAANGLVPTASYGWQANRMPVVAYQPLLAAPAVPAAAPAVTLPPASVAPTLAPSCNCGSAANTSYYGSTTAWSPVATDSAATWTGCSVDGSSPVTTTSGYAPASIASYGTVSDWTPVTQSEAGTSVYGYAPQATSDTTTLKPWQVSSDDTSVSGATPWMSIEEYRRQQAAAATSNPTPPAADEAPRLLPQSTSKVPLLDQNGDDQWRTYDDESSRSGNHVSSNSTRANYYPPREPQKLVPFNRPIPDPDRAGESWDFDDKLQLQQRESRSARATTRWRAIPVRSVRSSASQASLDRLLDPPGRATHRREEGGWRSTPQ